MSKVLSISVAAYNVGNYIGNLVMSISKSKVLDDIQLIIVNDGSVDNTRDIVNDLCNQFNFITFIDKENGGYGSTLNAALNVAEGKYFKALDGDDQFDDKHLDEFVEYLKKADSDIVLTPFERFYNSTNKYELIDRHPINSESVNVNNCNLDAIDDIYLTELCVKTSILKLNHVHISERCFYTDNELVFYSVLYSRTYSKFPKVVYIYNIGVEGQSVSTKGREKHYKDSELVLKKLLTCYKESEKNLPYNLKQSLYHMIYNLALFQYQNYLIIKAPNKRSKLIDFDIYIKKSSDRLYNDLSSYKLLHFMRKTHFHCLNILGNREKRKLSKL